MAEFLRLFEHYRARMAFERRASGDSEAFKLASNNSWSTKYYDSGRPECKARKAMSGSN
jgi:hypothetical protein